MKIGLVSDSHGKTKLLKAAMEIFAERSVEALVHCGDICSAGHVEILASVGCRTYLVQGNMDRRIDNLTEITQQLNIYFHPHAVEVALPEGDYLVATHGNDPHLLKGLIGDPQFPYVCHGHTHEQRDERIGVSRVINPGALHHVYPPTIAILETETDNLEFIEVS